MYTCVAWVKQGVAKEVPDKVQLTEEELKELVEDAKEKVLKESNAGGASNISNVPREEKPKSEDSDEEDKEDPMVLYNLDNYDEEEDEDNLAHNLAKLTVFATPEEDPYITLKNVDDIDREDFQINPKDNLMITGKIEDNFCCAEIHVYNEEEGSFYIHHDILLEAYPLAIEWLSFDSLEKTEQGNLVAIGTMEPQIQIWDLDIVDIISPPVVLGKGKKAKKKKSSTPTANAGHEDAVLSLSWNRNYKSALASGSADTTVVLWDLGQTKAVHKLRHHGGKVQGLQWHPYEAQSLLTCSSDRTANVLDCRSPQSNAKSWEFPAEVENCLWNSLAPFYFLVGTDKGSVHYCDVRKDSPVYTIGAHDKSVEGMALSSQIPGCLVTVSSDKSLKVWEVTEEAPKFVTARQMNMGRLHGVSACPDHPFTFGVVGEKESPRVFNVMETSQGKEYFGPKHPMYAVLTRDSDVEDGATMECDNTAHALASLNLSTYQTEAGQTVESTSKESIAKRIRKKKKKKK